MKAMLIDPRDAVEEDDDPSYRVVFWTGTGSAEEWRLTGAASVEDVLRWTEERRGGRTPVVWLEYPAPGGVGLSRLLGSCPGGDGPPTGEPAIARWDGDDVH